ncbi:MAG: hypothetical protein LBI17_01365, partial [Rickettsiales bacterium]|nr:hypothetical protein [Rickettsiales bacterium]
MKDLKKGHNEAPAAADAVRPDGVPAKFWDAGKGALDADALLKSYAELEKKLGSAVADARDRNVLDLALETDGADKGYDIALHHRMLRIDEEVNGRLRNAGFTNAQAQLVYDLAAEVMMPMVEELVEEFRAYRELERLEEHFGGEERFNEISRQLTAWAQKNVPPEIFESLNSSYYGVLALYNMMSTSEPGLVGAAAAFGKDGLNDGKLRDMMRDPRYWRDG